MIIIAGHQLKNCNYRTIKRYLKTDSMRVITNKTTELDNYSAQIYEFLKENKNFHQIYQEVQSFGYTSTYQKFLNS